MALRRKGRSAAKPVVIIPDRLEYVALRRAPTRSADKHFFSIDDELVYWNFFLDFGPLNLGQLYRFCEKLNSKLGDPRLRRKKIVYYSSAHGQRRANAICLLGCYLMLYMEYTPEAAWALFDEQAPLPPFHDASPCVCTYELTVLDVLRGVYKALRCGFFSFDDFDIDEYEHFEKVECGDLNWLVYGRFCAFAGPHNKRTSSPEGYCTLTPEDYIPYFKKRGVELVIRLNKKYYDEQRFVDAGIRHADLYYLDGSTPPEHILARFLALCEGTTGAIAVHCKAGLGRTGSCIGAYIMKHFGFTAAETIGWIRVCRPGSIIGPQQQYLERSELRFWAAGDDFRARLKEKAAIEDAMAEADSAEAALRAAEDAADAAAGAGGGAAGAAGVAEDGDDVAHRFSSLSLDDGLLVASPGSGGGGAGGAGSGYASPYPSSPMRSSSGADPGQGDRLRAAKSPKSASPKSRRSRYK